YELASLSAKWTMISWMLQRSGEGLYSHIFFGSWRRTAESRAGARPNDSSICRLSSRVMWSPTALPTLDARNVIWLLMRTWINAETSWFVPHRKRFSALFHRKFLPSVGMLALTAKSQIGEITASWKLRNVSDNSERCDTFCGRTANACRSCGQAERGSEESSLRRRASTSRCVNHLQDTASRWRTRRPPGRPCQWLAQAHRR